MNKNLMGVFLPCLPCFGYIILVLTFNWIRLGLSGKKVTMDLVASKLRKINR